MWREVDITDLKVQVSKEHILSKIRMCMDYE